MKTNIAVKLIAAERKRQIKKHRKTAASDDLLTGGQLTKGAMAYLMIADMQAQGVMQPRTVLPKVWPFPEETFQPHELIVRNLVKAGGMIAAEIDRLNRKAAEVAHAPEVVGAGDPAQT